MLVIITQLHSLGTLIVPVIRYLERTTTDTAGDLIKLITDPRCSSLYLYATQSSDDVQNTPLLRAMAHFELPVIEDGIYLLFDQIHMTAASISRVSEVQEVLTAAEQSSKVKFGAKRIKFVPNLEAEKLDPSSVAANLLQEPTESFSKAKRSQFFSLLSLVTEAEIEISRQR